LFNSLFQRFVLLPEVAFYLPARDQCLVGFSEIKDWEYFSPVRSTFDPGGVDIK